jgi:hypothetical protein
MKKEREKLTECDSRKLCRVQMYECGDEPSGSGATELVYWWGRGQGILIFQKGIVEHLFLNILAFAAQKNIATFF